MEKILLTCREVCENAQDHIDGDNSVWMRVRIKIHLAMCRNCTNFVDQAQKTKQLISQSLASDTKAEISSDLMAAFDNRNKKTSAKNSTPDGVRKRRQSDEA